MATIPRVVLIAPDSFKGTLSAIEVAEAIGRGIERAGRPVDLCPLADGGEGTLAVLLEALEAEAVTAEVSDPLGRPIEARFGLANRSPTPARNRSDTRGARIGVVEMAAASGLALLDPGERAPLGASTAGTGELIVAARDAGATLIYVGVGGSATTDGGSGAVEAIRRAGGLGVARLIVLCDVRTPFELAARVFGPQKGASVEDVRRLTQRLGALARSYKRDPRGLPMTGAAGGLSGGLWAQLGAELVPGASFVLDLLDFERRMRRARAVVTGEGRLDMQSLAGKVVSEVSIRARQAGVPSHAIVGSRDLDAFGARILDLQAIIEASTPRQLSAAGRRLAGLI